MKLQTMHYVGIGIGLAIILADAIFFINSKAFYFIIGIAFAVGALPFLTNVLLETGREKEKEGMFLEFSRNLVESVKAGTPISKSIINVRNREYGSLSQHVRKLANQIALGIPVKESLFIFARDVNNKVITRSVALMTEAEESGGKIDEILESVAKSVSEVEDIKKERKSAMYNVVVQLYIIFMIFLVIMLVMQIKFIPMIMQTMQSAGGAFGEGQFSVGQVQTKSIEFINKLFLVLIMVQGFFAGFVIGKLSEGSIKAGIKHSAVMIAIAYLITFGVKAVAT